MWIKKVKCVDMGYMLLLNYFTEVSIKNCEDRQASELLERSIHSQEMLHQHVQEMLLQFVPEQLLQFVQGKRKTIDNSNPNIFPETRVQWDVRVHLFHKKYLLKSKSALEVGKAGKYFQKMIILLERWIQKLLKLLWTWSKNWNVRYRNYQIVNLMN